MDWRFWRLIRKARKDPARQHREHLLRPDHLGYLDASGRGECELVIGFDFGTSASKVVVQAPFLPGSPRYLAKFPGNATGGTDWLWPSRFYLDSDGNCVLLPGSGCRAVTGVKLGLMDRLSGDEQDTSRLHADAAAATYLGLALRAVRSSILQDHAEVFASFATVRWSLNLGIPSGSTVDPEQEFRFRNAAAAGWRLSLRPRPHTLGEAALLVEERGRDSKPNEEGQVEIAVCPEVLAGVLGYARSDSSDDGLHLVVDVGASTVDACLFRLPKLSDGELPNLSHEKRWPLLEACVQRLGTAELHERRVAAVRQVDKQEAQKLQESYDPFNPLDVNGGIRYEGASIETLLRKVDSDVTVELRQMIGGLIQEARGRRDPNAPELGQGGSLPILQMGGGSRAHFYRTFVKRWAAELPRLLPRGNRGGEPLDVSVPSGLSRSTGDGGHRLVVAFGLSHPGPDLPNHIAPREIADIQVPVRYRQLRGEFVDKDHV